MPNKEVVQQHRFFNIARNAELVVAQDRDVVAFVPEITYFAASAGMTIYRDAGSTMLYQSSPTETLKKGTRALLWGRLSANDLVTGMRWVPYTASATQETSSIKPLIEVFSPRVVYDRTSNMLHLWFWTNFKKAYTGSTYDPSELMFIGDHKGDFEGIAFKQTAKRALCYTTGRFLRSYVSGGYLSGYGLTGPGFANATFDLVPIFRLPTVLNVTMGTEGPGIAADGWYGTYCPFSLYADGADKVGVIGGKVNYGDGTLDVPDFTPVTVAAGDMFLLNIDYYQSTGGVDTASVTKVSSAPSDWMDYTADDDPDHGEFHLKIKIGEIVGSDLIISQRWCGGDFFLMKGENYKQKKVFEMSYSSNQFKYKYREETFVNGVLFLVGAETEVVVFTTGPCPPP